MIFLCITVKPLVFAEKAEFTAEVAKEKCQYKILQKMVIKYIKRLEMVTKSTRLSTK